MSHCKHQVVGCIEPTCGSDLAAGTANIWNTWLVIELKHYFTTRSEALLTGILVAWVNLIYFFAIPSPWVGNCQEPYTYINCYHIFFAFINIIKKEIHGWIVGYIKYSLIYHRFQPTQIWLPASIGVEVHHLPPLGNDDNSNPVPTIVTRKHQKNFLACS
jgi:hypothetical protein